MEKAEREMANQKAKEEEERRKNEGEATGDGEREKQKLESEVQKKNEQSMWAIMQDKTKKLDIGSFFGSKDDTASKSTGGGETKELKKT